MQFRLLLSTAALFAVFSPIHAIAQVPDGTDINKAIPIYFGQIVSDIGDVKSAPARVYSITLAKGQQISLALTIPSSQPSAAMAAGLIEPNRVSVAGCYWGCDPQALVGNYTNSGRNISLSYLVPTAGKYYILVYFASTGVNYNLQVTATGTPISVPNPASAGCLTGRVDYITYSLQLIAASLADEVSIGGQKACASCTVKAPLYPEIVTRLENALRSKVNVEACYDSSGSIFQIKLVAP
jgi:hypothetical protein